MNVEDIQKEFGRLLGWLEDLKMLDPLDLPYEIGCIRNEVEDLQDDMRAAFEEGL